MTTAKKAPAKTGSAAARAVRIPAAVKPLAHPAATARPAAKAVRKAAAKTATRAPHATQPAAERAKSTPGPQAATKPSAGKAAKPKKPKLVRDSFTIPKAEYAVLEGLKQRAGGLARQAKKSELLRAGIKALAAMPEAAFLDALMAVPAIKTGRPPTA